jgi:hypothetical protein
MSYWTSIIKRASYVAKSNIHHEVEKISNLNRLKKRNLHRCTVSFSEVKIDQNFCFGKFECEFKKINAEEAIYLDGSDVNLPHPFSLSTLVQIVEAEKTSTTKLVILSNDLNSPLYNFSSNEVRESSWDELEKLFDELETSCNELEKLFSELESLDYPSVLKYFEKLFADVQKSEILKEFENIRYKTGGYRPGSFSAIKSQFKESS